MLFFRKKKDYNSGMKKLDFVVIALVAALSLLPLAFLARGQAARVAVTQHGELLYEGPLENDAVVTAEGCVVTIEDGRAVVSWADCPDRLCQTSAATPAHPLICLPNQLVVTVSRAEKEAYDGLAY